VPERDFSRPRHGPAANQASVADGVVRRAVWPSADQAARVVEQASYAVNARGLDGFFERHRRKNRGDALRQHRLARAGRTDQENVVAPGARYLESPLGGHLPADVA
jgi:hypothetical protein